MRLANMTWPQVETYFKTRDMVILPIGSIECHGRHMPLGTDTIVPDKILDLFEEKNNDILIMPTMPYGATGFLAPFPGTVDIGDEALYLFLRNTVSAMKSHGAKKFLALNGHGGNTKALERVGLELSNEGCLLAIFSWFTNVQEMNPAWKGAHGDGQETAAVMGIDPSLVDMSEIESDMTLNDLSPQLKASTFRNINFKGVNITVPRSYKFVTKNGCMGPLPRKDATAEEGKKMLKAMADYMLDFAAEFEKVKF